MTQLERREKVLRQLDLWNIPYTMYTHPPLPTVEIALEYWKDVDATHCKNLFMRNHKGNRHYLVVFECHHQMAIHDIEKMLHQGKLSFASEARIPFGLINDTNKEVKLFLDKNLQDASLLSFHPNDNTADLVVTNEDFMRYLTLWGGEWEYLTLY